MLSLGPVSKWCEGRNMKEIETRSTSSKTAQCTAIVLRETAQIRLVFVPTLVDNATAIDACDRGEFVYQKKLKNDQWVAINTIPLSSIKSGDAFKLELHSSELLTLMRELSPLYRIYRQHGIQRGRSTFVRLEASLARFLALGESELAAFLESHPDDAATTLLRLVKWLSGSHQGTDIVSRFAATRPDQLPTLAAVLGLAAVKDALNYWSKNKANDSEEFWQRVLTERAFVLSQLFAYPIVIMKSKAYLGGKQFDNKGGNIVDFLATIESTDAVILIEIKTPQTRLLGSEYRDGVFPISVELSGAVAQALRYRQRLMRELLSITADRPRPLTLGEPRCLIIAGDASRELTNNALRENFELQRERMQGVAIVTYDELFRRLERLTTLLEGNTPQVQKPGLG
jgi:hypothetical protein